MLKSRSVQRRRYALKVPAAHFMLGNCKPIAGSHDVEPMGWISSCLPRRPLPRCGGGERGGGKYAVATFGAYLCAVRTMLRIVRIQHCKRQKGVCQGGSPVPLDRVLVPFTRVKGTPPRRAVLTMPLQKAPRRRQATANYPPPCRRTGYAFAKGPAPPLGDRQLGLKIFYLLFLGEKQPLAGHEWRAKRDFAL